MLLRAKSKKGLANVKFTLADVSLLPFPDNTFDLIGISFATRNLNPSQEALLRYLREFHRILKPGGVFINLETSQPSLKFIRRLFHLYVKTMVYPIGKFFSGSESGYQYLSYTIPRFYNSQDFTGLLKKTGFQKVREKQMFLGVAAIHKAFK
jgi:demethylmenaquinone methyltransferase/2-methoxy-6-polyprenyl-1,4-benzoquinol methylase